MTNKEIKASKISILTLVLCLLYWVISTFIFNRMFGSEQFGDVKNLYIVYCIVPQLVALISVLIYNLKIKYTNNE